jgi:hypothetical protein
MKRVIISTMYNYLLIINMLYRRIINFNLYQLDIFTRYFEINY